MEDISLDWGESSVMYIKGNKRECYENLKYLLQ